MPPKVQSVALNGLFLSPGDSGGPETYLREIIKALATEYPGLRMTLFTTRSGSRALEADGYSDLVRLRGLPAEEYRRAQRQFGEQVLFPFGARRSAQLAHSLASTGPMHTPGLPSVVTLHDVTFLHIPTFGRITTWGMKQVITRAARDADALISGSVAARDDVCRTLRLDPTRFTVAPHGMGAIPRAKLADEADLRQRLGLEEGRRLALCVAAIRPHKNQEVLVRALASLPADLDLVLAGRHEPYADHVERLARELGVKARLRMAGFLPDSELERLWEIADVAVLPTLAEGFGLPLLEAMARGLPTACSDIPVLREVGGELPAYFDAHDPAGAARAVQTLLERPPPGDPARVRAARFSWSAAARGTMEAYERALARSTSSLPRPWR